jgi:hypothetical protein
MEWGSTRLTDVIGILAFPFLHPPLMSAFRHVQFKVILLGDETADD